MSAINQVKVPSSDVNETTKKDKETPMYKRTVDVFGYDVQYWVVALVVVVIVVVVGCMYTGKCSKQKVGLVNTGLTSVAGPSVASTTSSVNSAEVRAQLRELFEQF